MNTKKLLTIVVCLAGFLCYAQPPGGNNNRWQVHFADEFNTLGNPNTNIWNLRNQGAFKPNQAKIVAEGGNRYLRITNNYSSVGNARGAWLQSKDKFGPGGKAKYGYYEARVRVRGINNQNKGMIWPTWWVWGGNKPNNVKTTEFDLMEYSGFAERFSNGFATTSHHFRGNLINGKRDATSPGSCNKNRNNKEWHRWGMYWGPNQIIFYYDGIPYFSSPGANFAKTDPNALNLILSATPHTRADVNNNNKGFPGQQQICGNCNGFQANNLPEFAAQPGVKLPVFEVDWVRVWRDKNPNAGAPGNLSLINCAGSTQNGVNVAGDNNNNSGGNILVTMRKSNAQNFAIDGNHGGANGQNVYIWTHNNNNVNQQWEEINRGNGFYSYKKKGTSFCLDGGNGGANGQNVYLWSCNNNNQNQHWKKINVNGKYRLQKRNAANYSIDGGNGGSNGQNLYLWRSNNNNANQLWNFANRGTAKLNSNKTSISNTSKTFKIYPNPTQNIVYVKGLPSGLQHIKIINMQGRVVVEKQINITNETITPTVDVSQLSTGIYILNNNGNVSKFSIIR